ncbi:hypothetical protein DTO96_102149 [Ephemeroptericola cinctiostellae]|uniref:LysM domain-containing protein n=1 Tax=Ephemeroptericola cinctiostellae TaxID=2268024 RepID=A0A345DDF7_9BURK|nr:DNA circularization N-terminal domain-containing protein [Ephemeroptericola cinctiostellae]AXF86395.1 hypothetical protein DTO96_102149 [Ephemeroptericola cinctiostellae]
MSWLNQLQPASFRGVAFEVDTSTRSEGNNTVLREYPFQDLPTLFSMGQAAGEIKFSAYVIGGDYMDKANALEQALLVQESGVLIHPTIGSVRVWHHGKFSIAEAYASEGGMAKFDLSFVRAEARRYPMQAENTGLSAFAAAVAAKVAIVQDFMARYSLEGAAGWVRENIFNHLLVLHGAVFDVLYAIKQGTDGFADIANMGIGAESLLKDMLLMPQDLGARFTQLFDLPKNISAEQAAYVVAQLLPTDTVTNEVLLPTLLPVRNPSLTNLLDVAVAPVYSPYLTPSRQVEAYACAALQSLCQQLSWATLVQASALMEVSNYDVALAIRQVIHSRYEQHVRDLSTSSHFADPVNSTSTAPVVVVGVVNASHVGIYDALSAAHAAALTHLHVSSVALSRMIQYTPQADDSIYALSYQMYGSTRYADEIWAMNPHITNPLLVPAGVALRLVDHG